MGCSYVTTPHKVNDCIEMVVLCLQREGLIVVEVDAPLPNGFLSGVALVGKALMQLRLVESREHLSKADGEAVPVVFRVGEDDDVIFRKGLHAPGWIMRFQGCVCQAGPVV